MENIPSKKTEEISNSAEIQLIISEVKSNPLLKDVPEEAIEYLLERVHKIYQEEQYSYEGELPHPVILEGYEKFYPGATKRIIDNLIDDDNHKRSLELALVTSEIRNTAKGMNYALIVVIVTVCGACLSAYLGSTVIGSIIGVGGLATLAYTFIQGKKNK